MYRGSSFLLRYDYTVHLDALRVLRQERFAPLWSLDVGAEAAHLSLAPTITTLCGEVWRAYHPYAEARGAGVTDTLVTKVVLGTVGCLPACDRFVRAGLRAGGVTYSGWPTEKFIRQMLTFCTIHGDALRMEQARLERLYPGVRYPLMKLADMYFWQLGAESGGESGGDESSA